MLTSKSNTKINIKVAVKVAPVLSELEMVKSAGIKFVELYTNKELINSSGIANKFDFEYVVHAPTDFINKGIIDFAGKVGAKVIVMHKILDNSGIKKIVELAKKKGIVVCIENGGMYKMQSFEECIELKKKIPDIRFCLDTEHSVMFKTHPKMFELGAENIKHVHITGSPPGMHTPPMNNPVLVKEMINWLKKINYSGFLVAEMDKQYQTLQTFKKTKDMLEKLIHDNKT